MANLFGVTLLGLSMLLSVGAGRAVLTVLFAMFFNPDRDMTATSV